MENLNIKEVSPYDMFTWFLISTGQNYYTIKDVNTCLEKPLDIEVPFDQSIVTLDYSIKEGIKIAYNRKALATIQEEDVNLFVYKLLKLLGINYLCTYTDAYCVENLYLGGA